EFHLFFYWGDSFRPIMWEVFFELSSNSELIIALSATISLEMQEEIKKFNSEFSKILWVDLGNQILKFPPAFYLKAPSKQWISEEIKFQDRGEGTRLIFCEFRDEVKAVYEELTGLGFECISCVGGESRY